MLIKPLSLRFRKKGVLYSQVKRSGDFAIYALQYFEEGPKVGFDVVEVQRYASDVFSAKSGKVQCKEWDFIEYYPSTEQWGYRAWSFNTLEAAEKEFNKQIKNNTKSEVSNEQFTAV